jgi:pilin isopeptide linkage protein
MSRTQQKRLMSLAAVAGMMIACLFAFLPLFHATSAPTISWPDDTDSGWQVTSAGSTVSYQVKDLSAVPGSTTIFTPTVFGRIARAANPKITTIAMRGTLKFPTQIIGTATSQSVEGISLDATFSSDNGFGSLTDISGLASLDASSVISMHRTFAGNRSLTTLEGIGGWDVSHVTTLAGAFNYCTKLTDISALSGWKTSSLTDLSNTFSYNSVLVDLSPLSSWNASKVTTLLQTFDHDYKISDLTPLSGWARSGSLTNLFQTFYHCESLTNLQGLNDWNTANVTTLEGTFWYASSLSDVSALKMWDTSKVTTLKNTFNTTRLTSLSGLEHVAGTGRWDTSKVKSLYYTFYGASRLTDISALATWDVSNVENMSATFYANSNLEDLTPLKNWKTDNLTDLTATFMQCSSIADVTALKNWNTSNVTTMSNTFNGCSHLSDITALANWDTHKVTNMHALFSGDQWLDDLSALQYWDLSTLTTVTGMFAYVDWYKIGVPPAEKGGYKLFSTVSGNSSNIDYCTNAPNGEQYSGIFQGGVYSYDPAGNAGTYDGSSATFDDGTAQQWYTRMTTESASYTTGRVYLRPATMKITKKVENGPSSSSQTFSIRIRLDNKQPGAVTYGNVKYGQTTFTDGVATITLQANQTKTLTELPPTSYTIEEPEVPKGYELKQIEPASGTMVPHNNHSDPITKAVKVIVTNKFTPYPVDLIVKARKQVVVGPNKAVGAVEDSAFTFEMCEVSSSGSADRCDKVAMATNAASTSDDHFGSIVFPAVEYTTAGTHKYRIREIAGPDGSVTYDKNVFTLTVTVADTDNDGYLDAAVTGTKPADGSDDSGNDGANDTWPTSSSVKDKEKTTVTVGGATFTNWRKQIGTMPVTGDLGVLPSVVLAVFVFIGGAWLAFGKRK